MSEKQQLPRQAAETLSLRSRIAPLPYRSAPFPGVWCLPAEEE